MSDKTAPADISAIMKELYAAARPGALAGMARYGINTDKAIGASIPSLRAIAKRAGKSHKTAAALWNTDIHDARILASIIDEPELVTPEQMDAWAAGFESWDLCDQCCNNLFVYTPHAWEKAAEWSARKEEFFRRAGFVLMAVLAVHDKNASDADFKKLLRLIEERAGDDRNMARKAVNWALRQIGKRNLELNAAAIRSSQKVAALGSKGASWAAADALRELRSEAVISRLESRARGKAARNRASR